MASLREVLQKKSNRIYEKIKLKIRLAFCKEINI